MIYESIRWGDINWIYYNKRIRCIMGMIMILRAIILMSINMNINMNMKNMNNNEGHNVALEDAFSLYLFHI